MKNAYVYPILFAIYPIAALYSHNVNQAFFSGTILPTVIVLGLSAAALAVARLLVRDAAKAGLLVALLVVAMFSYGHVAAAISSWQLGGVALSRPNVMFTAWTVLIAVTAYPVVRTKRDLEALTKILTVVAVVLVVLPVANVVIYNVGAGSAHSKLCVEEQEFPPSMHQPPTPARDIYYIVLDRYGSGTTLNSIYGFDNTSFLDSMRELGFFVADESHANYLVTAQSLASSLNMSYINCLSETMGSGSDNWLPLFEMLKDYPVWRYLKSLGYTFVHAGPSWTPTAHNEMADINYNYCRLPEFATLLFESTMISPLLLKLNIVDPSNEKRHRINYQFDALEVLPGLDGPKFVFVHFLLPHNPFVFDRDGERPTSDELKQRGRYGNYIHQVEFANKRLTSLVERLIADSAVQPIIILQADEGPYPESAIQLDFCWTDATQDQLKQKMGILNALYLPDADLSLLYPGISPVNTFRVVFNLYFGGSFELLPDEHYTFEDIQHLYDFVRVTDQLSRSTP